MRPADRVASLRRIGLKRLLCMLWLCGSVYAADPSPQLLLVDVNGTRDDDAVWLLAGDGDQWWAPAARFAQWRLQRPASATGRTQDGTDYLPLHAIEGASLRLDEARQILFIDVPADALQPIRINASAREHPLRLSTTLSGFINYDLSSSHVGGSTQQAAVVEAGISGPWGALVGSGFASHTPFGSQTVRLDTTWTLDRPDDMRSLRVGDAITRAGSWGRAARFGGLQYATNFATQPGFITFPLPTLHGEAAVPSTVDLLINSARRAQQSVPPGPFALTNVPVISGLNQMQFIVRDVLGRERLVSQTFYSAPLLLRPGLDDFSFEAGALRRNYGRTDSRYDDPVASATYRRGLPSGLTGELRGELGQGLGAIGVGVDGVIGDWASAGLTVAGSHSSAGTGVLTGARFERRVRSGLSFSLQTERGSTAFRQLGLADDASDALRRRTTASASLPLGEHGSIGAGYVFQQLQQGPANELVSATWSQLMGRRAALSVSVIGTLSPVSELSVFAVLTVPLDTQVHASITTAHRRDDAGRHSTETTASLQRSLPVGPGVAYRINASDQGNYGAALTLQTERMAGTVELAEAGGTSGLRLGLTGGFGFVGDHVFASRRITDSFALVSVDGHAGVGVRVDNQLVARTDERGYALIPRLRAYEGNRISIDADALPLDALFTQLRMDTAPGFRSGVLVRFAVSSGRSATVYLRRADGSAVPAGAVLTLEGEDSRFPVGFDGMSFIVDIDGPRRAIVHSEGRRCRADIPGPTTGSNATVLICTEIE